MPILTRAAIGVALLATPLAGLQRSTTRPKPLEFSARRDGSEAGGVDGMWRGTIRRPDAGSVMLRVEHRAQPAVNGPAKAAPLHALVLVSYDDKARSFAAEVTGSVDDDGATRLTGTVNVGAVAGSTVDVVLRLSADRHLVEGTISFPSGPVDGGKTLPPSVMQYPPQEFP
ncbi:MAG TPA: hypothetical protein VK807_23215 [Gemmatimonadaceae bacterium]|nr:hypothetical protein [Gemmatimonadaceae bacterium]